MAILTLDEAKTCLDIKTSNYDAELPDYIAAAEDYATFKCGPSEPVSITEIRHGYIEIALSTKPVLSVDSVVGQAMGALTMSSLWFNPDAGVIRAKTLSFQIPNDYYTVTYTAGRASVPFAIKQGVRMVLADLWATRRGINTRNPGMANDVNHPIPGAGYAQADKIFDAFMTGPAVG